MPKNHLATFLILLIAFSLGCSNARYGHLTSKHSYSKEKNIEEVRQVAIAQHNYVLKLDQVALDSLSVAESTSAPNPMVHEAKTKKGSKTIIPKVIQVITKPKAALQKTFVQPHKSDDGAGATVAIIFILIISTILTIQVLKVWYITWGCLMSFIWPVLVFVVITGILLGIYTLMGGDLS